ncbi:MAG TPA: PSD1 and planctomycete cytochrome C domain-containing protein [Pirellulaceae bacterium]|nr:PSD1 and planctomycete cytochrome C domain-containing protein [Pirellulaceae bacterium]
MRWCCALVAFGGIGLAAAALPAAEPIDFSRQVLPILSDKCFKCHGPDEAIRQADLRLDQEEGAAAAIVAGKSGESELVRRVSSSDGDEVMPPADSNLKLTAEQIAIIKQWIDEGAKWGGHWAFHPPVRPALPTAEEFSQIGANGIDAFLRARLKKEGLSPSPEAPRESLIRRLSLDLTGLPPTLEDVDAFLADGSPDAVERLADRLFASPAYGERMAWDWLDAARYADSNGYQGDSERTMWPWRDWVVNVFNQNLPLDEFTVWQLAGDLLPGATDEQRLATGFCRNHMINGEGGRIAEENRVDYVMDMSETMGTVWLGLTFNCCRCHDHKFDPLSQQDYYSLTAFFNQTPVDGGGGNPQTPPVMEVATAEQTQRLAEASAAMAAAAADLTNVETQRFPREDGKQANESPAASSLPDNIKEILKVAPAGRNRKQLEELEKHFEKEAADYAKIVRQVREAIDRRDAVQRSIPRVMVMADMPTPRKTFMLDKGLYDKPQEEVSAATPANLPPLADDVPRDRLTLARWLVAPENPLTARVMANRFWQQFFGIGLVKTAEDFGVQGERPVHPELLDWLAVELGQGSGFRVQDAASPQSAIRNPQLAGWEVKRFVRRMITSAAYRQSSKITPEVAERDPENRLLARAPRYRLPAWMIRDQALAASGLLVRQIGGPPVKPYQPEGVWEEATFGNKRYETDSGASLYRRSIYTFWRRIVGPTMFFDSAARQVCTVKQARTNTPLHSLATLNDVTYVEAARVLAEQVLAGGTTDDERIDHLFRRVLARPAEPQEREVLRSALVRLRDNYRADAAAAEKLLQAGHSPRDEKLESAEHAAWTALVNAVFNLDEALTKE